MAGQVVAGAHKEPVVGAAIESNAGARRTVADEACRFASRDFRKLRLKVTARGFLDERSI